MTVRSLVGRGRGDNFGLGGGLVTVQSLAGGGRGDNFGLGG